MSYRPHGRADISPTQPRALGVCDRCGALYNHSALKWQYDWQGPKLQNLRFLVCESCYDTPQQNGQRTIILPADPVPIMNARPEYYVPDDNPLSPLGADPSPALWQFGSRIGTMTNAGGVQAAFDGTVNKPSFMSATIVTVDSSYGNYVGINWTGGNTVAAPSSLQAPILTHTLSSYTITAPNDIGIGSTAYVVQGSQTSGAWGAWTTIDSGSLTNTAGEVVSNTLATGSRFQFHRAAFLGGSGSISVAQVSFSVADGSSNYS